MSNRSSVDERMSAPAEASRRGAHRARPRAVPTGLPIVLGLAVILLVVAASYVVLISGRSDPTATISGAEDDTPSATSSASPSVSPSAAASPTRSATPSPTRPAAVVNRKARIAVLNSVAVQGLAARVRANLAADGWNVVSTGNSPQRNLASTTVYYRTAGLRATARKVVRDLQFGQVQANSSAPGTAAIVVVLGRDAE